MLIFMQREYLQYVNHMEKLFYSWIKTNLKKDKISVNEKLL